MGVVVFDKGGGLDDDSKDVVIDNNRWLRRF